MTKQQEAHLDYDYKQLESDWKALLSTHPDKKTLIERYGKVEIIELCREKLFELTADFNHESREYKRCWDYAKIRNLTGPAWQLSFEYRQDYLKSLKRQIDHLSLLYLTAVGRLPKTSGLKDEQIQCAREYPIENLYSGRLRKVGRRLTGLCPFHEERTSSFVIYDNNSFHCFGCQAHGNNALDFVMKLENLSFKEAVERLV